MPYWQKSIGSIQSNTRRNYLFCFCNYCWIRTTQNNVRITEMKISVISSGCINTSSRNIQFDTRKRRNVMRRGIVDLLRKIKTLEAFALSASEVSSTNLNACFRSKELISIRMMVQCCINKKASNRVQVQKGAAFSCFYIDAQRSKRK